MSDKNAKETKYEKEYNENSFWDKTEKYAKVAGEKVLEPALKMYHASKDSDTPIWAKTTIMGALGYFISPIDAIPDITPVIGYTDDLGVLMAAVATVAVHIKKEHSEKAKETLKQWFS